MKVCGRKFNLYLALAAALPVLLGGCQTTSKADKQTAALRIHIETPGNALGTSQAISVVRANPVLVNISMEPFLTEANVLAARIISSPGGFGVEVKFDETGGWMLEQYTAANPGKHLAIFGQWGEKLAEGRWLAAPFIARRIGNGVLAFTPDASREEADQFVLGLNNIGKKNQKNPPK